MHTRESTNLMNKQTRFQETARIARKRWGRLSVESLKSLCDLTRKHGFSVLAGDICFLRGRWYVTNSGLLALARRRRCIGIHAQPLQKFCDPARSRWVFRAMVYPTSSPPGFVGYGDADPSNVSPLVHGAELRVAETRAVNRALRKAYGIGICSVEEIGSFDRSVAPEHPVRKLPPESCNGSNGYGSNRNGNSTRVRDRLCQLIRQHKLDAELVKAYAVDFCGTKTLREASRKQVESFVTHLADWAGNDRNALLCQLNSYQRPEEPETLPQAGAA